MKTLEALDVELQAALDVVLDHVLSAMATHLKTEHNLPNRAAFNVIIDSLLDDKLAKNTKQ